MKNVFSFSNQKGGVGKTTSVVNIAAILSDIGYKTLIIDLDPQGNATSGIGVEKPQIQFTSYQLLVENPVFEELIQPSSFQNLSIIPANPDLAGAEIELVQKLAREFRLKKSLSEIKKAYDFIFLDCPPSLGMITINAMTASDYLIIPLQCEYYALEGLGQLLTTFQLIKSNLNPGLEIGGVLLTMADFRTNLTQQVIEEVKKYFNEKVFSSIVPRSVKVSEAPSFGKPAVFYDPFNRGAKSYKEIALEFMARFARHPAPTPETPVSKSKNPEVQPEEKSA